MLENNVNATLFENDNFLEEAIESVEKEVLENGKAYEQIIGHTKQKMEGVFFTNNIVLVRRMIEKNFLQGKSLNNLLEKKVLEPSVGNGIFVLELLSLLLFKGANTRQLLSFVENNVVVYENNSTIINLYRRTINLFFSKILGYTTQVKLQIRNCDFTRENVSEYEYDFIMGNPPFISFYGPKGQPKDESLREYYLEKYSFLSKDVKNGRLNSSMFFLENGIKALKNKAKLTFILDISFLEPAFRHIRKYILDTCAIVYFEIGISTFDGVGSGQMILSIQKNEDNKDNIVTIFDRSKNEIFKENQKKWNSKSEGYKFTFMDNRTKKILEKIETNSKPLIHFFPGKSLRTNTMLLNLENKFVFPKDSEITFNSELVFPFYEGSKSLKQPYGNLEFSKMFFYNEPLKNEINDALQLELSEKGVKNKKRVGFGDLEVYKLPKIFIRQSADRLIATYTEKKSTSNNSLYSLSNKLDSIEGRNQLKVATVFLNSKIMTFYALKKKIIKKSKGKQPQIRLSDLRRLPLSYEPTLVKKLLSLFDDIYCGKNNEITIKSVDNVLYEYFDLDKSDVLFIENYLRRERYK